SALRQQVRCADLPDALVSWFKRRPRAQSVASDPPLASTPPSEIREFFNRAAADEEHYPSTIDPRILHVHVVLDHLGDLSGQRVADVGCGKGRFARIVAERNPEASV